MGILEESKKIKNFKVTLDNEEKKNLKELVGEKGLILYFYPRDNTPGCTREACNFRDGLSRLNKLGYKVVGVSADSIKSHQKFKTKHQLNFPLISDTELELSRYFGVWGEKKMYGKVCEGIFRTTFIMDKDLKIIKVYPNVKVDKHLEEILNDLQNL